MSSIPIQTDEGGAYLTVGPERADELRVALSLAAVAFDEEDQDGAGCAGPIVAVFRLASGVDLKLVRQVLEDLRGGS